MEHILQKLNNEILQSWGFEYDLAYWINPKYKLKLQSTEEGYTVYVLTGLDQSTQVPIQSNGELFSLIAQQFQSYLSEKLSESKFINKESQLNYMNDVLSEYFSFDKRISMVIHISPMGLAVAPGNEYTHTLLSGLECIFKVKLKTKDSKIIDDIIYYHPSCISYGFLKELYPNYNIVSVEIQAVDDGWEPFFGTGIPK